MIRMVKKLYDWFHTLYACVTGIWLVHACISTSDCASTGSARVSRRLATFSNSIANGVGENFAGEFGLYVIQRLN